MTTSNVSIHENNSNVNTGHSHPQQANIVLLTAALARIRFSQNDLCDTLECMIGMYLHRVKLDYHKNPKTVPYVECLQQCEYIRMVFTNAISQGVSFTESFSSQNPTEVANG